MEIKVLGSLVVRHREGSLTPTAAKPRTVLAMLAMHANDVVPVKALVDELWGDAAPRSARTTVQTYVVQLRKLTAVALGNPPDVATRSAKQILATVPGGYMLSSPDDQVDVRRFEQQASAGHRAREHGDFEEASKRFADALSSWRGPALADIQTGPHLSVETTRLEEARLNALYCRIEADLRLGRHHELLSELAALVARHRTHEGLCAHLMLALYRSGRRCEALDIYHRNLARAPNDAHRDDRAGRHRTPAKDLCGAGVDALGRAHLRYRGQDPCRHLHEQRADVVDKGKVRTVYASIILWDLSTSAQTVASLRGYLRDHAVNAYAEVAGLRQKVWVSAIGPDGETWGAIYLWDDERLAYGRPPGVSRAVELIGYRPTQRMYFSVEAATEGPGTVGALAAGVGLAYEDPSAEPFRRPPEGAPPQQAAPGRLSAGQRAEHGEDVDVEQ